MSIPQGLPTPEHLSRSRKASQHALCFGTSCALKLSLHSRCGDARVLPESARTLVFLQTLLQRRCDVGLGAGAVGSLRPGFESHQLIAV